MDPGWALVVPAYLLGTFPTALLVGRREGRDPTQEGSGNPGASNALRTMGRRAGALVLLGDLGKGTLATGAAWALAGRGVGVACGLAAVLGHVAPVTRGFRGGKGVATAAGMAIVLLPVPALVLGVLWAAVVKATGVAAAGSLAVAVGLPVAAAVVGRPGWEVAAFAVCAGLVVLRHRENLGRLRRGEEPALRREDGPPMNPVRKAVIPAAGLGTRFLPATKAQPKEMLPVVDKPAIQYVVEEAVRSGIDDILIITGRGKRSLEDHFDRRLELEHELASQGKHDLVTDMRELSDLADIHYVRQGAPLGLGHAVSVARKHVGREPFAVMLGDDIMDEHSTVLSEMIATHERTGSSVIACKEFPPEQISSYGSVAFEPAGDRLLKITGLVEKPTPEEAPSSWAVLGRYVFTPGIFEALEKVEPGRGGEIQLTDAIGVLLATEEVLGYTFEKGRYDVGNKLDYLRATVELALDREDLGPPFRAWLAQYVRDQGIV